MADDELQATETQAKIFNAVGSVVVPIIVGGCGALFSWSNYVSQAREQCAAHATNLLEIVDKAEQSVAASPSSCSLQVSAVKAHRAILEQTCQNSDTKNVPSLLNIPEKLACESRVELKAAPVAATTEILSGGNKTLSTYGPAQTWQKSQALPLPQRPAALPRRSVTLYVQISEEAQRTSVRELLGQLNAPSSQGNDTLAIATPGIELVAPQPSTTLRCLKAVDCERAAPLLDLLRAKMPDQNISLLNLSARFENASSVREGTYELWFQPGTITVN